MSRNPLPTQENAHAPNSRPKTAYLEMDRLAPGPCDMEFRPSTDIPLTVLLSVVVRCFFVAVFIPILTAFLALLRLDWLLQMPFLVVVAVTFLVLMMIRNAYHPHPIPTYGGRYIRTLGRLVRRYALVCVLGVLLYLILPNTGFINSLRLYLVVSIVMIGILADSLATHAVYWMTASPTCDMTVLQSWRDDWRRRHFSVAQYSLPPTEATSLEQDRYKSAIFARSTYLLGFACLAATLIFPVVAVLAANKGPDSATLRFNIMAVTVIASFIVALIRCRGRLQITGKMASHWLEYIPPEESPPWVFRSPRGRRADRRIMLYATVALISILMLRVLGGYVSPNDVYQMNTPVFLGTVPSIAWSAGFCLLQIVAGIIIVTAPILNTIHDLFEEDQ